MDDNQGRGPATPHGWQPPSDVSRLEEIEKRHSIAWKNKSVRNTVLINDVPWLLKRVGELERENEKLKREVEGLHAMIQQAIHPQSE